MIGGSLTPVTVLQVVIGMQEAYDAKAADVWSMGICLFVMTMGAFPFLMVSHFTPQAR